MVRVCAIMLVSCCTWGMVTATAHAQVDAEAPPSIGVQQATLAADVSALLDGRSACETLLSSYDSATWTGERKLPQYETINRQAIRLRVCSIYLYQTTEAVPDDSLWRERLASYGIRLVEIPGESRNADLFSLAAELGRLFPERRDIISENLYRELERRNSLRLQLHFARYRSE